TGQTPARFGAAIHAPAAARTARSIVALGALSGPRSASGSNAPAAAAMRSTAYNDATGALPEAMRRAMTAPPAMSGIVLNATTKSNARISSVAMAKESGATTVMPAD